MWPPSRATTRTPAGMLGHAKARKRGAPSQSASVSTIEQRTRPSTQAASAPGQKTSPQATPSPQVETSPRHMPSSQRSSVVHSRPSSQAGPEIRSWTQLNRPQTPRVQGPSSPSSRPGHRSEMSITSATSATSSLVVSLSASASACAGAGPVPSTHEGTQRSRVHGASARAFTAAPRSSRSRSSPPLDRPRSRRRSAAARRASSARRR